MKRILLLAFPVLTLVSCSAGHKADASDTDSIETVSADVRSEGYECTGVLTQAGIGPVAIGVPMCELPDSVNGLYTAKALGESPDAVAVVFSDGNGESFVAYDFGEGNVDVINLIGTDIKVEAPQGDIVLGDSFAKVLQLPGVKTEWSGYDDSGMWYWTWEGLWFAPSQDALTPSLSRKLYHSVSAPGKDDFDNNVTIGFIGTGLPF